MAAAMRQTPQAYTLLHVQCDFLRSKGKQEWAVKLARQAVNCAPSEFVTWEKLAELYIDLRQYESALLTLNSCPMFTFNGRDAHRTLPALKVHLPFQRPIGEILPDRHKTEDDEAEAALQRLPAPGLRGTWARAYALLTRLVSQIGWDELLKTRSQVFVMEEEYRMQKAQGDIQQALGSAKTPQTGRESDLGKAVFLEDGTVVPSGSEYDDNASTRGVIAPTPKMRPTDVNGSATIPTIRISSESARGTDTESGITKAESPNERKKDKGKGKATAEDEEEESGSESGSGSEDDDDDADESEEANGKTKRNGVDVHGLEKPVQAAGEGEQNLNEASPAPSQEPFSFSNKRLCERWLDNLFMVLYEVCKIFFPLMLVTNTSLGPSCLDHLPRGSGPFQDSACRLSQDWSRMGNSWRSRPAPTSQGGSKRGLSAMP